MSDTDQRGPAAAPASITPLPGDLVCVRAGGKEFVIAAACPHRKGRLVHGYLNERNLRITCPLHRTSFDLTTGEAVAGPSSDPLTIHSVRDQCEEATGSTATATVVPTEPTSGDDPGSERPVGTGTPDYQPEQVWCPASEQLLEWDTGFHDLMLGDDLRMAAFRAAIFEAVRPGMTVLDLGTGTGILARWALEAGAARVYGIDLNDSILQAATTRIEAAGFGDRWHPIAGLSFAITLPERVDLIISEIMGNLADNEGFAPILADARERFLAPHGEMIPRQVESYLVPVAAARAHEQLRQSGPVDVADPETFANWLCARGARDQFDLYYDVIVPGHTYLSAPRLLRSYDLTKLDDPALSGYRTRLVYTVQRDGVFTGFKGYFIATLSETVALDISGDDIEGRTTSDSWKHCYLPIAEPIPVFRGDRIAVTVTRSGASEGAEPTAEQGSAFSQGYQWVGEVVSGTGDVTRFAQSTTGRFPQ